MFMRIGNRYCSSMMSETTNYYIYPRTHLIILTHVTNISPSNSVEQLVSNSTIIARCMTIPPTYDAIHTKVNRVGV